VGVNLAVAKNRVIREVESREEEEKKLERKHNINLIIVILFN